MGGGGVMHHMGLTYASPINSITLAHSGGQALTSQHRNTNCSNVQPNNHLSDVKWLQYKL